MDSRGQPIHHVYVDGVFDLFHAGHVAFLQKARAVGTTLHVGVISDQDAAWKRRPVMSLAERLAVVRACRYVDGVVEDPPLRVTVDFLDRHGFDVAVHGDDDLQARFFGDVIAAGRMVYVPYHAGVSTSLILARIRGPAP
jgi:cytidyltransferase-like protein